jgi:hypothetical protein
MRRHIFSSNALSHGNRAPLVVAVIYQGSACLVIFLGTSFPSIKVGLREKLFAVVFLGTWFLQLVGTLKERWLARTFFTSLWFSHF